MMEWFLPPYPTTHPPTPERKKKEKKRERAKQQEKSFSLLSVFQQVCFDYDTTM